MNTLKSNKLPLVLAGVGASLGALGWMAQTDWFKTWLESLLGADKTITNTKDIINNVSGGQPDSNGFVSWGSKSDDIKAELKVDLIMLLAEWGYPPVDRDEVYKEIFEQAENFKRYALGS